MAKKTESEATKVTGRPTVFTDAIRLEICERLAEGETVRQICRDEHMPAPSSVYLELVRNEAFSELYAKAREAQLARWEDELMEIADDGSNDWLVREGRDGESFWVVNGEAINRSRLRVDTRKWIMSKRLPKKYGDRVSLDGDLKVLDYSMLGQAAAVAASTAEATKKAEEQEWPE